MKGDNWPYNASILFECDVIPSETSLLKTDESWFYQIMSHKVPDDVPFLKVKLK